MPRPRMVVVAGPPGRGKTTRFPVAKFGVDFYNADNRAAELNGGSFRGISKEIRSQVNNEFQQWILDHISARESFALETTLRSEITFEQAKLARQRDFWTSLNYVSLGSVAESIKRIKARAYRGGHSASETLVREIYARSTRNLVTALHFHESSIDRVEIYDNSVSLAERGSVRHIMSIQQGRATYLADSVPFWLDDLLKGTRFEVDAIRKFLNVRPERDTYDFDH